MAQFCLLNLRFTPTPMATVDLFHAEDAEVATFRAGQDIFREGDPGGAHVRGA
jgi:hypothetical protein